MGVCRVQPCSCRDSHNDLVAVGQLITLYARIPCAWNLVLSGRVYPFVHAYGSELVTRHLMIRVSLASLMSVKHTAQCREQLPCTNAVGESFVGTAGMTWWTQSLPLQALKQLLHQ